MSQRDLIRPVHGGNLAWAAAVAGCSPDSLLDFSASINPLGPPSSLLQALQAAIAAKTALTHYPDPGYRQLCQFLGQQHGVPADWVLPGNGAAELLTWACRDLAAYRQVGVLAPGFGDYWRSLAAFDAAITPYSLLSGEQWHWGDDFSERLLQALAATDADLSSSGILINNPHNPSGYLLPREVLLPLLEHLPLVVVDEAFMDFLPPDQQESLIADLPHAPNLVVLRSLTKFYSLPGLRLGYALGHPQRLQRWQQWRDPWPVNGLAELAAQGCLRDQAFQQQTWNWLAIARPQLAQGLAAIPGLTPLPAAANFLLVRSDYPVPALQQTLLCQHQILIRDCLSFPELSDRYFRIAVRTPAENQQLLQALQAVIG